MAQKVFRASDVWLTKDANAFMAKNLTLVPDQKKELDEDLIQRVFLRITRNFLATRPVLSIRTKCSPH